jgi:pimeloyl-ACP methyl ester carboxylesterase
MSQVAGVGSARVNGITLHYEIAGAGEPIFLVGGSGLGRPNLAPVEPYLVPHFTVVAFDQRGYGDSGSDGLDDATIETWVDDLVGLMDAREIDRAHVHGASFGGMIALATAVRHPDRCLSVIPNGCFGKPDAARTLMMQAWADHSASAGISRGFAAHIAAQTLHPDYLDANPGALDEIHGMLTSVPLETWLAAVRAMLALDLEAALPSCPVPALLLAGEIDTITPIDMSPSGVGMRRAAELMPNGELEIFAGIGHGTPFEVPEQQADAIIAFAARVRARQVQTA